MRSKLMALMGLWLMFISSVCLAVPTIQHWQLANGVQVYFVPTDGLPILDAQLVFDAGSARDGEKSGLASLTSGLLEQGAGDLNAQQIAEQFESVGAQLGVSTSRDFSAISFRSLTDDQILNTAWSVLKKVVTSPTFPAVDFQREKDRTLLSIKQRQESPGTLAQLALYGRIFQGHPYAKPIQGEESSVTKLAVKDLKDFYSQYYVANKLTVVLVGGISRQRAEKLVEQLVGKLKAGKKAPAIAAVNVSTNGGLIHQDYPSQQTHLLYGMPVLAHNDPDYFALYIGNHILGGSGFSSRIVKDIREARGLAYSAYSYFHPMLQKGPFIMGLQTKNESVKEASAAVKQLLENFLLQGPSDEEVIAAKKNIGGGFALKLDSNKKLLGNVVSIVVSGAPLDYLNTYVQKIESVTTEQIREVFQRRLIVDSMTMVTVGQTMNEKD
jgi:zinc protease